MTRSACWYFDQALLCLLATMRAQKLTPSRLAIAAGFYVVFAIGLIPILS